MGHGTTRPKVSAAPAQEGNGPGACRGSGGEELPRGAREQPAQAGSQADPGHRSAGSWRRSTPSIGDAEPLKRLQPGPGAHRPARRAGRRWRTPSDLCRAGGARSSPLPRATASARASRYAAWREVGVPGVDAQGRRDQPLGRDQRRRRSSDCSTDHAVGRPQQGMAGALGVGHQPHDVAALVADAGDVVDRAVRVVHVAQDDPVLVAELGQRLGRAGVVALEVVDRDVEQLVTDSSTSRSARSRRPRRAAAPCPQRNLSPAFFCSAPGSRWASVSTWNPLQMPTTGPPAAAKLARRT